MERNFYTEGFEGFLKDKSDQYKLYPSDKVWKNINKKLHPKRRWPYLAAALLLVGLGVGGKFYVEENSEGQTLSAPVTNDGSILSQKKSKDLQQNNTSGKAENAHQSKPGSASLVSPLRVSYLNPAFKKPEVVEDQNSLTGDEFGKTGNPATETDNLITYPDLAMGIEADQKITNSPDLLMNRPIETIGAPNKSSLVKRSIVVQTREESEAQLSLTQKAIYKLSRVTKKTGWEFHIAPSVSYRRLIGKATDIPFNYTAGTMYSTNAVQGTDVRLAVDHDPSIGMEVGGSLVYPLTKNLRVRAGLQFNYNRYQIKAYSYKPELATFGVDYSGANARSINTISYYRNYSGNSLTRLHNERFMFSVPLGVELTLFGNDKVTFNVASTIQPTYIFDNNSFLISTNLKNYAQEPKLYRNWNVNAGLEGFLSIKTGSYNWVVGPQFRYQILSSYKDNYPISEHLVDYGFKIGVMKPIR
ncbi:hypothetical protein [Pollutibacter soli]|uniref:hypothetical protein n=1 Tax=Pollutibacter soli TaxID=3034157 RepID=UPI00301412A2